MRGGGGGESNQSIFLGQIGPSPSAAVDSPQRLLMEWRDEGGSDSNESSLARSAWKRAQWDAPSHRDG
jgi:hypothetical protein